MSPRGITWLTYILGRISEKKGTDSPRSSRGARSTPTLFSDLSSAGSEGLLARLGLTCGPSYTVALGHLVHSRGLTTTYPLGGGKGVLPVPHLTVFTLQVVREPGSLEKVRGLEVSSSYLSRTGGPSEDGV